MKDVDCIFLPRGTYKQKPPWTIGMTVWTDFLVEVLGNGYTSFFGVYVDFISYLIVRKFALFDKEGNRVGFLGFEL